VAVRVRLAGGAYHRVGSAGIDAVQVAVVELPTLRRRCWLACIGARGADRRACEKIVRARRRVEDSTNVRRDEATQPWRFFHTLV